MVAAMIFDDLRQRSPVSELGCNRLDSLSDLKANGGMELGNGDEGKEMKESKILRRKRMDLRRVRSFSVDESYIDLLFRENNLKKQRSEVVPLIEDSLSVRLPEIGGGGESREVPCLSHGSISVIGRRREMEDMVAAELGFLRRDRKSYDFFGVYDGHGGPRVAQACGEMLHKILANVVEEGGSRGEEITDWPKVMAAGFKRMDEEVNKIGTAVATVGSTAVVAVVGEEELVVANCGDSRAVLCRGGVAVPLSDDHKPDRADELERIELSGGKVIDWHGQRVLGVLATSRSIGDEYLKPYVISEPEVTITARSNTDEFVILASDGLWDVVSNELACQVVRRCFDGQMSRSSSPSNKNGTRKFGEKNKGSDVTEAAAAAMLGELALSRGSRDNISVVVVGLKF